MAFSSKQFPASLGRNASPQVHALQEPGAMRGIFIAVPASACYISY